MKQIKIDFKPSSKQYELWKLLQDNKTELILSGGAAGGGKSFVGCTWIASSALRFPKTRYVIGRKTITSLLESTGNTLFEKVLKPWGLRPNVDYIFNQQKNTVTFSEELGGSVILFKELAYQPSDTQYLRLAGLEITGFFVDEVSEIEQKAVEVLSSRVRWNIPKEWGLGKGLMSTNPTDNWIRSRFVQDDDGNDVAPREGEAFCRFSVYDNPDKDFVKVYEKKLQSLTDYVEKRRLLFGDWDTPNHSDALFYYAFDGNKHLVQNLKEKVYDPLKPLILSIDYNSAPHMSALLTQVSYDEKKVYILAELVGLPKNKENNTPAFARMVEKHVLKNYRPKGGFIVTGDPSSMKTSTTLEAGVNEYKVLTRNMRKLTPSLKVSKAAEGHKVRGEFINNVFEGKNPDGWEILIDLRCRVLTKDFTNQLKNADGTKDKTKTRDSELLIRVEKFGHMSDCLDYQLVMFLRKSYSLFKRGGRTTSRPATAKTRTKFTF